MQVRRTTTYSTSSFPSMNEASGAPLQSLRIAVSQCAQRCLSICSPTLFRIRSNGSVESSGYIAGDANTGSMCGRWKEEESILVPILLPQQPGLVYSGVESGNWDSHFCRWADHYKKEASWVDFPKDDSENCNSILFIANCFQYNFFFLVHWWIEMGENFKLSR